MRCTRLAARCAVFDGCLCAADHLLQIRDVLDMKKNKWVPRRETFTAKKLEEVHAEAEAELGIVSSKIASDLPALPGKCICCEKPDGVMA